MTNEAFGITKEPISLNPRGKAPGSGVEYLAQLFAMMDRQCILYPMLQAAIAGAMGFLIGSRMETSGWFVGGDGSPLGGEFAMAFFIFFGFGWWITMTMVLPVWRQAFFDQFISQLNATFLLYLVLEHRSHDKVAYLLDRDPIFPWVVRNRTHEPFSMRIRSFIFLQPAISRALGMQDYPGKLGHLLFCAVTAAAICFVASFITQSQFLQATLWFCTWFLLAGAAAFRQVRIQALSYTIASFFVRWLDAY